MVELSNKQGIFQEYLPKIKTFAEQFYDPSDDLHGLGHVQRVLVHAKKIWEKEEGNWDIIEMIIWLHDIGRKLETKLKQNHAIISKQLAQPFLESIGLKQTVIDQILHGIVAHSFSLGIPAKSIEAKIVSDADKLDALGAIGIYRVCAYQSLHAHGIKAVIIYIFI